MNYFQRLAFRKAANKGVFDSIMTHKPRGKNLTFWENLLLSSYNFYSKFRIKSKKKLPRKKPDKTDIFEQYQKDITYDNFELISSYQIPMLIETNIPKFVDPKRVIEIAYGSCKFNVAGYVNRYIKSNRTYYNLLYLNLVLYYQGEKDYLKRQLECNKALLKLRVSKIN